MNTGLNYNQELIELFVIFRYIFLCTLKENEGISVMRGKRKRIINRN